MLSLIILIVTIILGSIYLTKFTNKKHKFWDRQPVSRDDTNIPQGIISETPNFNIKLPENYRFLQSGLKLGTKSSDDLLKFINNNFSDYYKYSKYFLYETLTFKGSINIQLLNNENVIGFIHAKPIKLSVNNDILDIFYVDFLCVHKNYRGKNIAALLISKLLQTLGNKQPFIFKKESKSLPFKFINESDYYYIDIAFLNKVSPTNQIKFMEETSYKDVYNFMVDIVEKNDIFQKLTYDEFVDNYAKSKVKQILVEYNNLNEIIGVIVFIQISFLKSSQPLKTIDVEQIFVRDVSNSQIIDGLIKYGKQNKINIISLLNQSDNQYFIDKYKMFPSLKVFYHMYNYHIPNKINSKKMGFNFL